MRGARGCALLLLLLSSTARAESQEEQARRHFVVGQQRYRDGQWQAALDEFQVGYALSPRPEFLINFAQVYRKLGQYDRAIANCERFLATGPPPALADEAQRLLTQLREERAKAAVAPSPAPRVAPMVAAPAVAAPPRRSRAWIWGVVIGGVVVAGGVALAVGLALSPSTTFPDAPLGTVSFK